jgi:hypothetical protein
MEVKEATHDQYYATNHRQVGAVVEKSMKNSPRGAKYGNYRWFLGEDRPEPKRGASITKELRTAPPPHVSGSCLDSARESGTIE